MLLVLLPMIIIQYNVLKINICDDYTTFHFISQLTFFIFFFFLGFGILTLLQKRTKVVKNIYLFILVGFPPSPQKHTHNLFKNLIFFHCYIYTFFKQILGIRQISAIRVPLLS